MGGIFMLIGKYKANIRKIFAISFFNSWIFAYVIERIFALDRGLSILEIQLLLILYSVISLILEVPAGVLADQWKKKYVLALGYFFCFFEFFISIFAYDFTIFSLAFLAAAVGGSMKSGTLEAILYQSLKEMDQHEKYEQLQGILKFIKYSLQAVASIAGGYIADQYGLTNTYWFSLIGFPFSIIIALSLYEQSESQKEGERIGFIGHIFASLTLVKKDMNLAMILLYSGITSAVLYGELHEMSSLVYPQIGIPVHWFGYISFAITLAGGLGGLIAGMLRKRFLYGYLFHFLLFLSVILISLFGMATRWWEVIFLLLAIMVMEAISPLASGYLNHRIDGRYRVTINSIDSFLKNGLSILVGLMFGVVADAYSISLGFILLAGILALFGLLFLAYWLRSERIIGLK
jgi:MFS family permease